MVAELCEAFGLSEQTLQHIRAAITGVELIKRLPPPFWTFRTIDTLDPQHQDLFSKSVTRLSALRTRRDDFARQFDLAFAPGHEELRTAGLALRSANFLSMVLRKRGRDAKKMFRGMSRSPGKLGRQAMANGLLLCAQYLIDVQSFEGDPRLRNLCGNNFAGLDTPLASITEVNTWAVDVRQRLAHFGPAGAAVRDVLFSAPLDKLERIAGFGNHTQFAALLRTLQAYSDERDVTCAVIADRERERISALSASLANLRRTSVRRECGLPELDSLAAALRGIESRVRSLESDKATLAYVGGGLSAARANQEAIAATLQHANNVAGCNLPNGIIEFLFSDVKHHSWLILKRNALADSIASCRTEGNAVVELAKLDCELWCSHSGLDDAPLRQLAARCQHAIENAAALQDYINFLLAEDAAIEAGIGPVLSSYVAANQDYRHLVKATEFVFYKSASQEIIDADPRLRKHSGATHQQLREQYQQLDREFLQLRRQQLASTLLQRRPPEGNHVGRVADLTELGLVRYLAGQTRPRVPVRELLRRAGQAVRALKPCWMMSPMSVAQFIEPGGLDFDLVIMDEASQIRPEEALGAVARAKQVVIVGDQMQLPPTPFFQKLSTDGADEDDDADFQEVKQESVLEAAAARFFPPRRLKWHYRSEHGSLISFSNHEFYDDQLTVFPSPYHDHPEYGVKLVQVNGTYGSGLNADEGRAVVAAAAEFMKDCPNQSLGIVAVNAKQADFIREELDRLFTTDEFAAVYVRKWESTLESLIVKNLENVQGDERDVIFISTVYGKDAVGNFHQRYGPINSIYGHRRLNVLFTRAKKRVVVFTSMAPEQIEDEGRHRGVRALKLYLQYARDGVALLPTGSQAECDSEFERWVLDVLQSNGYDGVPQLGFSGYRIDIAVRNPSCPGTFLCGIECDGASYHSARSARERDRLRQEVLQRYGWKIYRIWSTDWFRNPSLQTRNLLQYLKQLQDRSA